MVTLPSETPPSSPLPSHPEPLYRPPYPPPPPESWSFWDRYVLLPLQTLVTVPFSAPISFSSLLTNILCRGMFEVGKNVLHSALTLLKTCRPIPYDVIVYEVIGSFWNWFSKIQFKKSILERVFFYYSFQRRVWATIKKKHYTLLSYARCDNVCEKQLWKATLLSYARCDNVCKKQLFI